MSDKRRLGVLAGMAAVACSLLWSSTPVEAKEYNAALFFGQSNPLASEGYLAFSEAVKRATNGEVSFKVFMDGTLLQARESMKGVGTGIAQVAFHGGAYTPSELPLANLLSNLALYNSDPFVLAFATTELNLFNPSLQAEWKRNRIVYGGGYGTPPNNLFCRTKVGSLKEAKGLRIRTGSVLYDRLSRHLGAVPVSMPSSEIYSGLDRGNLDCVLIAFVEVKTYSLWDVVKSAHTMGLGPFYTGFLWGYNQDFWKQLTPGNRRVLFDEMARSLVRSEILYMRTSEAVFAEARKRGVLFVEPDETAVQTIRDFIEKDSAELDKVAKERFGIADPRPIVEAFRSTVDKWDKLLKSVDRTNEEEMLRIVKTEIYDRLDERAYGLK